jgi:hypothetical protein
MPACTRPRKRPVTPRTPVEPDALLVEAETLVHFHGFAWQRGRPTAALKGKNVIPELARRHHLTTRSITRALQVAKRNRRAQQRTIPVSYAQGLAAAYAGQQRVDPRPRAAAAAAAPAYPTPLPSPAALASTGALPTTAAQALATALVAFLCRPDGAARPTIEMAMALLEDIRPRRG